MKAVFKTMATSSAVLSSGAAAEQMNYAWDDEDVHGHRQQHYEYDHHTRATSLEHFELKLVLEVTRHGQRAPEKIYDLAADPEQNFKSPHNLTDAGARNQYATGNTIRDMLNEIDPDFLSNFYKPEEIYVQTTCHSRCLDSAVAQLEGLYDLELQFPKADRSFEITQIACHID